MSTCPSIHHSTFIFFYLFTSPPYLSIHMSFCLPVCQSTHQPLYLSTCSPTYQTTCLPVNLRCLHFYSLTWLPVHLSKCLAIYLSTCLPVTNVNLLTSLFLLFYLFTCLIGIERFSNNSNRLVGVPENTD